MIKIIQLFAKKFALMHTISSYFSEVSHRTSYWSFGFIPTASLRSNMKYKFFGAPNLFKRLQAKDIMQDLALEPMDQVLDFGCGSGYFTIEIAKKAQKAYGVDKFINGEPTVPHSLKEKLTFLSEDERLSTFSENQFSLILASEVIQMVPNLDDLLQTFSRVLRPGGRLVICNGAGHPSIQQLYSGRSFFWAIIKLLLKNKIPNTYEDYCKKLNQCFNNTSSHFFTLEEIQKAITQNGFLLFSNSYTPGHFSGSYLSFRQFIHFVRTGKPLVQHGFILNYFLLSILDKLNSKKYKGGLLLTAINSKSNLPISPL